MVLENIRPALVAAALAIGAAAFAPGARAAEMPAEQRTAIEGVIRDYLLKNPEVLQEAMAELEKRQQDAQRNAQVSAVREQKEVLLNSANHVVIGNPNGDVTLVEFFDYNCGYCKKTISDIDALIKADPKLRVVLKDFPVLGPDSVEASFVAVAARNQLKGDKYFEFHRKLMETKGRADKARALTVAKELGVDMAKLQKDMEAPETRAAIAETVGLGDKLGLTGTPAFVIGDEVVFGAVGEDSLKTTIASARR